MNQSLARRITIEAAQTAERLARLELELEPPATTTTIADAPMQQTPPPTHKVDDLDWIDQEYHDDTNDAYDDTTTDTTSTATQPTTLRARQNGRRTFLFSETAMELPGDRSTPVAVDENPATVPPTPLSPLPPSHPTPTTHTSSPRYVVPTTNSLSRKRSGMERSLDILKRQQARTEQQRLDLIVRKGHVDSELDRALCQLKATKVHNSTLVQENQSLRSKLSSFTLEKQQLTHAMVHASEVGKTARLNCIKRYKDRYTFYNLF